MCTDNEMRGGYGTKNKVAQRRSLVKVYVESVCDNG
jgi:hypothetical protein